MSKYKIADLIIDIDVKGRRLKKQSKIYRADADEKTDIKIDIEDEIRRELPQNPHLSRGDLEYILTNIDFFHQLLQFNGVGLHASAVVYENAAYLFSAPSGTGKSTHTQLWRQYFGKNKTMILNDDKPALRRLGDRWYAFGTPWSGSTDWNVPIRVPLGGIAFLERSETNSICRISSGRGIYLFLNQTLRPFEKDLITIALDRTIDLLKTIPFFLLQCRPDLESVRVAYEGMKNPERVPNGASSNV